MRRIISFVTNTIPELFFFLGNVRPVDHGYWSGPAMMVLPMRSGYWAAIANDWFMDLNDAIITFQIHTNVACKWLAYIFW